MFFFDVVVGALVNLLSFSVYGVYPVASSSKIIVAGVTVGFFKIPSRMTLAASVSSLNDLASCVFKFFN